MNWMVRQTTEMEVAMNSVERMMEYNAYAEEAPAVIPGHRPPAGWPSKGARPAAVAAVVAARPGVAGCPGCAAG
jgi:hypothetical protein